MIHQFGLREGSGGVGEWRGGDGVIRDIEFLEGMQVSILSEVITVFSCLFLQQAHRECDVIQRRTRQPYGMEGGGPGALGRNTWIKRCREEDGDLATADPENPTREINIGGKATIWMGKGDRLRIETPGGGAWGVDKGSGKCGESEHQKVWEPRGSFAERAAAQAAF